MSILICQAQLEGIYHGYSSVKSLQTECALKPPLSAIKIYLVIPLSQLKKLVTRQP